MELLSCWVQLLRYCLTLCHCMDCCPPGSSARGISQARIREHLELNQKSGNLIDLLSPLEGSVLPQISGYLAVLKPPLYHGFRKNYDSVVCACCQVSRVRLFETLWTEAHQGCSVHEILQAWILAWVARSASRGSSRPRDWTLVFCGSCFAGGFLTAEPLGWFR